jgi:hypothetical protein
MACDELTKSRSLDLYRRRSDRPYDIQAKVPCGSGQTPVVGDQDTDIVNDAQSGGEMDRVEASKSGRPESGGSIENGIVEWKQRQAPQP